MRKQQIISTVLIASIVFMLFLSSAPLLQSSYKANADAVTNTIRVGSAPKGIAYNPDDDKMYVVNYGQCTAFPESEIFTPGGLSTIDLNDNSNTYEVTGDCPRDIAWSPKKHQMFVTNSGDDETVSVIAGTSVGRDEPVSLKVIDVDDSPYGIAFNSADMNMYEVNNEDDNVQVIGDRLQEDNVVLKEIPLRAGLRDMDPSSIANISSGSLSGAMVVTKSGIDGIDIIGRPPISQITSKSTGDLPIGVAYNPRNELLYVTNYSRGTVTIFDTANLSMDPRELWVGTHPTGIVAYRDCMFVVLEGDGAVKRVCGTELGNQELLESSRGIDPIKVGTNPWDIAFNPANNNMYVTNSGDNTVSVISLTASSLRPVTKPLETVIPVGEEPLGIAFNPANENMYVTSRTGNSVTVLSGSAALGTIPAPSTVDLFGPYGIAFNAQTQRMYVANQRGDSTVSTLSDTTIEDTITAGAAPTGVAFEPLNNLVYVTNLQDGTVSVISGNRVVDTVEVGGNPFGVATNTVNTKVYVTSGADNNFVSVIDDGNVLTKTIEVGASPHGIAFNPSNNKMYVANYNNDSVSLIDVNTDVVTNTITGIRTPGSIAYNPVDNSMYVTNFESDSVTVIEDTIIKSTIPGVGDGPYAIAFNPANEKMYVTNEKENSVTIIGPL